MSQHYSKYTQLVPQKNSAKNPSHGDLTGTRYKIRVGWTTEDDPVRVRKIERYLRERQKRNGKIS